MTAPLASLNGKNRRSSLQIDIWREYVRRHSVFLLAATCSIVFFITAFYYVQFSSPPSGDEPHYLIISQTLLKYHSLNVMLDYNAGDYRAFYPMLIAPHVSHNPQGQLLPLHGIGGPILWLIPFALLGRLGAVFFISLVSVLVIVNIYKFLLTMNIRQKYALIVSLVYAIASPLYIYAHLTFIEPIGAFVCIYVLRKIFQKELRTSEILISSLLLGILPWVHIRFAMFEVILFAALLYRVYRQYRQYGLYKWHRRANVKYYAVLLLPVIISFLVLELYNYRLWGTFNPAANEINDIHGNSSPFVTSPLIGMLGVFFDQQYGLLINFPVFLFLVPGIILAIKKQFRAYNLLMLLLTLPYLVVFSSFRNWMGGYSPPARFMLALLPLYAFYLAYALEQIDNRFSNWLLGLTVLYGVLYNLLSLRPTLNGFNVPDGHNKTLAPLHLFQYSLTNFLPSSFLPDQTILFVTWICLFVALAGMLLYSRKGAEGARKGPNPV